MNMKVCAASRYAPIRDSKCCFNFFGGSLNHVAGEVHIAAAVRWTSPYLAALLYSPTLAHW